jgi:hypothetical protein
MQVVASGHRSVGVRWHSSAPSHAAARSSFFKRLIDSHDRLGIAYVLIQILNYSLNANGIMARMPAIVISNQC